jgi:hypothetical protein
MPYEKDLPKQPCECGHGKSIHDVDLAAKDKRRSPRNFASCKPRFLASFRQIVN